jgi:hypothetical protein
VILDFDSITGKSYHRIEINENYYVPIDLLYKNSSSSIFIGVDGQQSNYDGSISDFFVFDWIKEITSTQKLVLKNNKTAHLIVFFKFSFAASVISYL